MRGCARGWAVTAGLGAVMLLVAVASFAMDRGRAAPRDVGVTSAPSAHLPATAGSTPSRRSTRSTHGDAVRAASPAVVTIPSLGVRALVRPVGTSDAELDVPPDPAQLGWWTGSARVGAGTGTVVIDGHVDSAASGPGALFRLQDLHVLDRILVATTAGQRQIYLVTGRRVYVKARGLPPDLFTTNGPPRLVLITCGGPFDPTTGSYLDNIVVFASPT